jgi:16S rRNA (adenine1518-N6/adenine1519-N6)-dimethyltransferase
MLYNNQSELLKLLKSQGLYTEKKLGQNFLFNTEVIEKIIAAADIKETDHVVEVGPGLGILTMELLQKAQKVSVIEKDPKLIDYLRKTFKEYSNLEIIHQDVLKTTPPHTEYKVVANIPYYITSPIITHFLNTDSNNKPSSMTLMTQLEVAQKICAKTGDHSVLSLMTQLFAKPTLVHQVSASDFFPAPKVKSAIIHLETLEKPQIKQNEVFIKLIKKAFNQRRKTLSNSLTGFLGLDKTNVSQTLAKAGIEANVRPQNLEFAQWNTLINSLPD